MICLHAQARAHLVGVKPEGTTALSKSRFGAKMEGICTHSFSENYNNLHMVSRAEKGRKSLRFSIRLGKSFRDT